MTDLILVTTREANQRLSELLSRVEGRGEGFLVTKRGRPVARILPVEEGSGRLTAEQEAALDRILGTEWDLGGERLDRDALYDR